MNTVSKWLELSPGLINAGVLAYTERRFVCPYPNEIWRAFEFFTPEETRVVLLGTEPYPVLGKASGLAHAYHRNYIGPLDSGLVNTTSCLLDSHFVVPGFNGDTNYGSHKRDFFTLEHWAEQGVLLLNVNLTVEQGFPGSHSDEFPGWKQPVLRLIQALDRMHRKDLVWMTVGDVPERAVQYVQGIRIHSPGPGITGFSEANEALHHMSKEPIEWGTIEISTDHERTGSSE